MDLREAVVRVLRESNEGTHLLATPNRFWGCLADMGLEGTSEGKVLRDHCDAELLAPYYEAAEGDSLATGSLLTGAAHKASDRLCHRWVIERRVANKIANDLAGGIADYLGISWEPSGGDEHNQAQLAFPGEETPPAEASTQSQGHEHVSESRRSHATTLLLVALVALVATVGGLIAFNAVGGSRASAGIEAGTGASSGVGMPSQTKTAAKQEHDQNDAMAAIIADAKALADEDDYESAYGIVKDGLKDYPNSEELQQKGEEYKGERDEIENIIDRAEGNAANKSFDRALDVIDTGLKTYPKSQKLKDERSSITQRKEDEADAESSPSRTPDAESGATMAAQQPSRTLPQHWAGSYTGNSVNDAGENFPVTRMVWFDLSESGGQVSGTCSIGQEDGSSNVDGTFTVTGSYNSQTGEITILGSEWISQGDLWGMRNFWGTVDADLSHMSGTCQGLSSGKVSDWYASSNG